MEAARLTSRDRSLLERSRLARLPDGVLKWGLGILSALILVLIVFFFYTLLQQAQPAFSKFGVLGFTFMTTGTSTPTSTRRSRSSSARS